MNKYIFCYSKFTYLITKNLSMVAFNFCLLRIWFFSLLNTDGSFRQSRPNLTSLLVQPISASFAKKLIALPKLRMDNDTCRPLELPYNGKVSCASLHLLNTLRTLVIFNISLKLKGLWFSFQHCRLLVGEGSVPFCASVRMSLKGICNENLRDSWSWDIFARRKREVWVIRKKRSFTNKAFVHAWKSA